MIADPLADAEVLEQRAGEATIAIVNFSLKREVNHGLARIGNGSAKFFNQSRMISVSCRA